jgi:hypothetical protein
MSSAAARDARKATKLSRVVVLADIVVRLAVALAFCQTGGSNADLSSEGDEGLVANGRGTKDGLAEIELAPGLGSYSDPESASSSLRPTFEPPSEGVGEKPPMGSAKES